MQTRKGLRAPPKAIATDALQKTFQTALHQQANFADAKRLYEEVLKANPRHFDALHLSGVIALQTRKLEEAEGFFIKALAVSATFASLHLNYGNALKDMSRFVEALASYDKAISLKPDYAEAYNNRGNAFMKLQRQDEALADYDKAIALKPAYAEAHNNRGNALKDLRRADEALASYDRAIALKPDYAEAFSCRGLALTDLDRLSESLASFEKAIALRPDYADAYNNLGVTLHAMKRSDFALACYDKTLALNPDYVEAYNNRGVTLQDLRRLDDALASYDKAVSLRPDYAEAHRNGGNALRELKRFEDALEHYDRALSLKPDFEWLAGSRLHLRLQTSQWAQIDSLVADLKAGIEARKNITEPFPVLGVLDDPALQRLSAELYIEAKYPYSPLPAMAHSAGEKIRIGYFSADFHNHATAYLMAEMFERHDRNTFELIGFSFGPATGDEMQERIKASFDRFIDVRFQSDREVAELARSLQIDIALDLKGFTQNSRTGIFAHRCAPIQVNYIGYPGTMAADYMDYIIADHTIIPAELQQHYSEKVAYLPNSYQVNDSRRKIADIAITRSDLGLPDEGFVFCCFNNSYKILPSGFDAWMRILKAVDGGVLWLLDDNDASMNNLKREAEAHGVSPDRLVFAKRLPLPEHLARHRCADLFLDNLPCNAHTTASDALWAGLPVLTCIGQSFAGRVAASLLNAVGLPDLIATSMGDYEQMAVRLATHADELAAVKRRLADNRLTSSLFDTPSYVRHVEAAYVKMVERHRAGLAPDHIHIEDRPAP